MQIYFSSNSCQRFSRIRPQYLMRYTIWYFFPYMPITDSE